MQIKGKEKHLLMSNSARGERKLELEIEQRAEPLFSVVDQVSPLRVLVLGFLPLLEANLSFVFLCLMWPPTPIISQQLLSFF